jgi:putative membrane protein
MVKSLTPQDHAQINAALQDAETETSAKIKVVVLPASDPYQEFILLTGLLVGSAVGLALWSTGVMTVYPILLVLQLGFISAFDLTPWLRRLCVARLPAAIRYRHATRRAFQEYHAHLASISPDQPFVLLFVSVAERYVHVITNPVVHRQIPDNWSSVIDRFTATLRKDGLTSACVQTVAHIAEVLKNLSA